MSLTLEHLPDLTPDQANVVLAMLATDGHLIDAANFTNLPLARFLDLLESPGVQAHLGAAERASRRRARTRLADAAYEAIDTLEHIARDQDHDKTERRRAATTILRALAPRLATAQHKHKRRHCEPNPQPLATGIDLAALARIVRDFEAEETSSAESSSCGVGVSPARPKDTPPNTPPLPQDDTPARQAETAPTQAPTPNHEPKAPTTSPPTPRRSPDHQTQSPTTQHSDASERAPPTHTFHR